MKCPVCGNVKVEMMWGCAITHVDEPNETVERGWVCNKCESGGMVGYVQDLSSVKINVNKGVKP